MSNYNFWYILFALIVLQTNIICEVETESISIGQSKQLKLNAENSFNAFFDLKCSDEDLSSGNILVISSKPNSYLSPGYIYTSFENKNPSADSREFSSQLLGKNNIYINTSNLKNHSNLYINVHSLEESEITLELTLINEVYISPEEKKIKFKISEVTQIYFSPKDITSNKVLFYGLGENIKDFSMKVEYDSNEFKVVQKFENGYGSIVDLSNLENKDSGKFIITVTPNENSKEKKVEIGFDYVDNGEEKIIDINILEHIHGATEAGLNCYKINDVSDSKNATMLLNSYTQALTFVLINNGTKAYSLDVFNNYFIKLPIIFSDSNSYFCLKTFTPKENEKEELGEISYDFQIYYENDLSKIQSFIIPLINGKVYTHSLNSGDIFIYRHNTFSNLNKENNIYSANLLNIRGKPKMYGYSCKTYPECNLDETKFNELKEKNEIDTIQQIGQYFVNKRENALGNTEISKNSESVSEAREQYLTVVKCESTEDYPNYGECKYSIEINNELDEIELAPEIVYATSLISPVNNFKIKIPNFIKNTYLKIFFTVLTGNADIYLYADEAHKTLIKNYNYRHGHRREIFEIVEDLKENYYIEVKTTDSSFIELKYETDFYFRGYNKMNPNEINIELVNKENDYDTFEIQNPNYFYPTDNVLNNDFYFMIKSLDCEMEYIYNFKDPVKTTTIYHEVKKNDINYGTSYAFKIKVGDYYHTVKDGKEDCAMIVYTGEKSQNTPLLIFADYPHPSNFSETYYIYPFIYNKDFNGIFVDLKFDYEYYVKDNYSPSIEVTFKIGNQKDNFDVYQLKDDYTFFFKDEIEKYCLSNTQCSLSIEIKKVIKENEVESPCIIKTNVYNAKQSPEYIFKNKVYSYNILPNKSRYFYSQIDLDEEGEINVMFNKGSGKIYAKLVEKTKVEENSNWNKRVKLPEKDDNNLLNYDSILGVVKYTKENTNICKEGCELYLQIKSEELTNYETDFTEVSFSITKKSNEINNYVEMRLNEYVKGNINKDEYKYYSILIPKEYVKISVNLYSPYGKAYIKIGNEVSNIKEDHDYELTPSHKFGRIIISSSDEKINKDSLKDTSFIIAVTNIDNLPEVDLYDYLYYNLEVQSLYNNEKAYYQLTSERSIICDTENDNYCHIIIPHNQYHNEKLYFKAKSLFGEQLEILKDSYQKYEIEEKSLKDSIQDLFPSADNPSKLKYEIKDLDDYYYFITVFGNKNNNLIECVLSGNNVSQTLLPYNTDKYLYMKQGKIDLFLSSNDNKKNKYIVKINTPNNLNLNINDNKYNINGNYYFEVENDPNEKAFQIECDSNQDIDVFINYEKKNVNNFYELDPQYKNEINVALNEENFPYHVYTKTNKPVQIELLFHEIEYKEFKNEDLFDINAYIVDDKTLDSLIVNPKTEIKNEKIEGFCIKYEKAGIINISSDKFKNDSISYIYIVIEKNENNKNIYNKVKMQYSLIQREGENFVNLYPKTYYYRSMEEPSSTDYYYIQKSSKNDTHIIIDMAENIPVYDNFFVIVNPENEKTEKNMQVLDYNGRKRIIVNLTDSDGAYLWVTKNHLGDNKYKNYSLIYYSVDNLDLLDEYSDFNNSIIINKNKEKSTLLINNIKNKFNFIKEVTYYVDIIPKENDIKFEKRIDTIYMGNRDESIIKSQKMLKSNDEIIHIDIDYDKNETLYNYTIRLIAQIVKNDGSKDKYKYNATLVDFGGEEEEKKDEDEDKDKDKDKDKEKENKGNENSDDNTLLYILIPIIVLVVIIAVIIIVILIRKKRVQNSDVEKQVLDDNMDMPLQEKSNDV